MSWSQSFAEADTDGDGVITPYEFQQWYENTNTAEADNTSSSKQIYVPSQDVSGAKVRISRRGSINVTLPDNT